MTEYCYPECTTSVITCLATFKKHYPHYRPKDIEYVSLENHMFAEADHLQRVTTKNAISYLRHAQKPVGGWVGSWGICFTYATMFALESFSLVGETYENSLTVKRACEFLLQKQRTDGGWGESYKVGDSQIAIQDQQN